MEKSIKRSLVDLVPTSPISLQKNGAADSKKNYLWDLGSERVKA